jgi:hypothetical protein
LPILGMPVRAENSTVIQVRGLLHVLVAGCCLE